MATQLVQDAEAMGIDVTPVIHRAVLQPMAARQCIPAVTGTKDNDGITNVRERQKVGLVLGDEYALHCEPHATEGFGIKGHVGACRARHPLNRRIEHSEANERRLFQKPVTGSKLADTGFVDVHSVNGHRQIEQLGQPSVPGNDHAVAARQERIGESELGDAGGDLRHLLFGVVRALRA